MRGPPPLESESLLAQLKSVSGIIVIEALLTGIVVVRVIVFLCEYLCKKA